jgi:hypothetical protein
MTDNIVTFPGLSPKRGRTNPVSSEPQEEEPKKVHWRTRERIQEDIEMHMAARVAYGKAVAWEAVRIPMISPGCTDLISPRIPT